jgi:hypothetical protein
VRTRAEESKSNICQYNRFLVEIRARDFPNARQTCGSWYCAPAVITIVLPQHR